MLDSLTLDQMRILTAVADAGSFSAAARRLGRVQSAVSQSIQTLESALEIPLFDRSARTPRLTDAGEAIVKESRAVLRRVQAMRAMASSVSDGLEAELTLAVDAAFPMPPLIETLKELRRHFPSLPVTLFTEGLRGAEARLKDGSARLAIIIPTPQSQPDFDCEFLANIALTPVVAAAHPLAAIKGRVPPEFLREHVQLVLTERSPAPNAPSAGILADHIWRFADMLTRLEFLLEGFGWCRMPRHLVEAHIEAGRLVRLDVDGRDSIELRVEIGRERGRAEGPAGRWLIQDLRERLKMCPSTAAL